jgi:MFS family permease
MATTAIAAGRASSALSAFKYRNYRLYFFGQLISMSGTWMQTVAQGWLVFNLTKSELALGLVACAAGLPSLILSPIAGVVVERLARHKILLVTQTLQMLLAFALAALTFGQTVQVWHVLALAFFLGATNALDAPARQALVIDLVGKEDLSSGITLTATMFNASRVLGPSIAGIALVSIGPGWCFFLNGVSFIAVIVSLLMMNVVLKERAVGAFTPLRQLRDGLRFSRYHETIAPLLLLAAVTSVFTLNVATLLPAFADKVLHSPTDAYALLSAMYGIGAVIASLLVPRLGGRFGRGKVVLAMALITPPVFMVMALVTSVPLAAVLTLITGFQMILQFVTMNTLIQSEVPDQFRGRVLSLYTLTFFGLAPFGALALGGIAEAITTPGAIMVCAVGAGLCNLLIYVRAPALRRLS